MAFNVTKSNIPGVLIITSDKFKDNRGYFMELSKMSEFKNLGLPDNFPQYNLSYSTKGVIRGLHFQNGEHAQGKLVHAITGHVRDVFVDMRKDSPTYLQKGSVDLKGDDNVFLYVPAGFAHGFSVLSDEAHFLYGCSNEYTKSAEGGIRFDDPKLNIDWGVENPIISQKDLDLPFLP